MATSLARKAMAANRTRKLSHPSIPSTEKHGRTSCFPFMQLPLKIREVVYKHVLTRPESQQIKGDRIIIVHSLKRRRHLFIVDSLNINRLIKAEAERLYYSLFAIPIGLPWGKKMILIDPIWRIRPKTTTIALHLAATFFEVRKSPNRGMNGQMQPSLSMESIEVLRRIFPNLQHITISVALRFTITSKRGKKIIDGNMAVREIANFLRAQAMGFKRVNLLPFSWTTSGACMHTLKLGYFETPLLSHTGIDFVPENPSLFMARLKANLSQETDNGKPMYTICHW